LQNAARCGFDWSQVVDRDFFRGSLQVNDSAAQNQFLVAFCVLTVQVTETGLDDGLPKR
jgi:hypothetical protein